MTRPVVCKPKYSMTLLCSTAAPDCRTGQSKGRYLARVQSQSLLLWQTIEVSMKILTNGMN